MTENELSRVKFKPSTHLNMGSVHVSTDESVGITPKIWICTHCTIMHGEWRTTKTHFKVNGKVYKTRKSFLNAIKDIEFKTE